MKLIKTHVHRYYPKLFTELKNNLYTNVISDINHSYNRYQGETNFLHEFGINKSNVQTDTVISRIVGNIPPHSDNIDEFQRDVYLLVLDVSVANQYVESQSLPMLFQNNEFIGMRKGDLIKFSQRTTHALFWDRRIDIATFWTPM